MTEYDNTNTFRGSFRHLPVSARFDALHMPVPESGCWLWLGSLHGSLGYGCIKRGGGAKAERAHRFSWEQRYGPIPAGMCVCHKCDVPSCVNPDHLFLGSSAENTADKVRKGRHSRGLSHSNAKVDPAKGERNHQARLSADDVLAIRGSAESQRSLARRYGVTQAAISSVIRGRTWRHVA